ncbi:MAG: co-chaperone GroES [Actinomycetota bacterium]
MTSGSAPVGSTPEPRPASLRRASSRTIGAPATSAPQVRLTGDRIVVEHPDSGERTSRGGLLIPATAQPAPKRCIWSEVRLVGPDVRGLNPGDRILFLPQAGLEIELDGEEYLLLRERDVQAVAAADPGGHEPGQYL